MLIISSHPTPGPEAGVRAGADVVCGERPVESLSRPASLPPGPDQRLPGAHTPAGDRVRRRHPPVAPAGVARPRRGGRDLLPGKEEAEEEEAGGLAQQRRTAVVLKLIFYPTFFPQISEEVVNE